jgi:hypothetical protein
VEAEVDDPSVLRGCRIILFSEETAFTTVCFV